MKKKKNYAEAQLDIVLFSKIDIITTSGDDLEDSGGNGWGAPGELDKEAWD